LNRDIATNKGKRSGDKRVNIQSVTKGKADTDREY
jgi:hypothetical protein